MKRLVHKRLEGYAVYNKVMPTDIERFFSGSHDTYKEGMPENNKELCEAYIKEHHPHAKIDCIKATLYYEVPEGEILCNQSPGCSDNVCYCDELIENARQAKATEVERGDDSGKDEAILDDDLPDHENPQ